MGKFIILLLWTAIACVLCLWSCESEQGPAPVNCSASGLVVAASSVSDASGCTTEDGSVTVIASGGSSPYQFKVNDGALQSSGSFDNLTPGSYTVTVVDDNDCTATNTFQVLSGEGNLAFTSTPEATESGCKTENATITVAASGDGTIQYKLDNGSFSTASTFDNVGSGAHIITIMDESGCTSTSEVVVFSGISYETNIHPIIVENCAISGCHNGDNGADKNWLEFNNVQAKADRIKSKTADGSMPKAESGKTLTQQEIDMIACWVDDGAMDN